MSDCALAIYYAIMERLGLPDLEDPEEDEFYIGLLVGHDLEPDRSWYIVVDGDVLQLETYVYGLNMARAVIERVDLNDPDVSPVDEAVRLYHKYVKRGYATKP